MVNKWSKNKEYENIGTDIGRVDVQTIYTLKNQDLMFTQLRIVFVTCTEGKARLFVCICIPLAASVYFLPLCGLSRRPLKTVVAALSSSDETDGKGLYIEEFGIQQLLLFIKLQYLPRLKLAASEEDIFFLSFILCHRKKRANPRVNRSMCQALIGILARKVNILGALRFLVRKAIYLYAAFFHGLVI